MIRYIQSALMVVAGLCWLGFALLIGWFLFRYLGGGAGLQGVGFGVSSATVLVGLVHVLGFAVGTFLCFVVGVWLCAQGLVCAPGKRREE